MKKATLLLVLIIYSLVLNAQNLELKKNVRIWDAKGLHTPAKAASVDNASIWGYYLGGADGMSTSGTGGAGTFRVAIYVPGDGVLQGAKIQGINLPVLSTNMTDVSVWGGTTVGATNLFSKSVESVTAGYTQVVLDDEVEIPAAGMYVGYTFTIASATTTAEQYPIGIAQADEVDGSLYIGFSATAALDNYSCAGFGVSALQVLVSGMNNYDNGASISSVNCYAVKWGTRGKATVNIESDSKNGVKSVGYVLNVIGVQTTGTATLSPSVEGGFGKTGSFDVEFDAPAAIGTFPASIAITEVNGVANEGNTEAKSFAVMTLTRVAKRVSVVEEYTGNACGYCPRGLVGMEYLKENRPDNCLVINWHHYNNMDPMYVESYASLTFDGAPECCVDRKTHTDPYYGEDKTGIHHTVDAYSSIAPTVDITSATAVLSEDNTQVKINADAEFLTHVSNYTVAFVLTADGLTGTTSSWEQHNYYFPYTNEYVEVLSEIPALGDFCSGGSMGKNYVDLTFNDILIAHTYSNHESTVDGVTSAGPGEVVSREATIMMPTKEILLDAIKYDKIYANILFIDDNGDIANAKRVQVVDASTGINDVKDDDVNAPVYNIVGQRVGASAKGLLIKNGKKYLVK